ncbi:50S ribosomal protein L25 [candidate division KSB1 bacterium]|nr:50S ribosomal protein L25 [candidate division KSB1 bacterium]
MSEVRLRAEVRDLKKTTNAKLRRAGIVPGVYYTRTGETRTLQFEARNLNNLMRQEIGLLHVELNGETLPCIVREVQRHPTRRDVVHIDLMGIVVGQKLRVHVTVHPTGTARGIKEGGTLELVLRELEIECEPADLPTHIDIDVTNLSVNEGVRIEDLRLPGVTVHGDQHATVVHVIPPRVVAEAAATVAAPTESKEPEVIREKKVEEAPKKDDKKK